jgi:serine/threonine protein kinase
MHHPSIVEFYRAFAFEDHTYVVLELCPNGSLMDMVKNRKSLSLPEVRRYMIQLCGGVKYMHQRCVIHRDLKMGNIFIDAHMNIKIGDFGLAAVVVDDKDRRQTMCGTPNYIAPELLAKSAAKIGHGQKVDTWAIGIICYAMLIGTPPFASKSQSEIYEKLKQLQYEWKEDCQFFVPNQAKDLVTLCLNLVPAERPGMDDLVEHEFFKMGAIADQLDRSCLRGTPLWLEHADPRGDKVTAGYGVEHAAICEASGVGKTSLGKPRPSVGGNVNMSAMVEVHMENAKGCAPVIPMPEGVIYKEFAAAKEDWNTIRKRPLTIPKVRTRKEPASVADTTDKNAFSKALPGTDSARTISTSLAPSSGTSRSQAVHQRASVQSFAAQQRQQALPSQPISRRVISSQVTGQVAPVEGERAPSHKSPSESSLLVSKRMQRHKDLVTRCRLREAFFVSSQSERSAASLVALQVVI